jgi:hypothetical protein
VSAPLILAVLLAGSAVTATVGVLVRAAAARRRRRMVGLALAKAAHPATRPVPAAGLSGVEERLFDELAGDLLADGGFGDALLQLRTGGTR